MDKIIHFLISCIILITLACESKTKLYVSKKKNIILFEKNGIIEGYTLHPNYSKYKCSILFKGKASDNYDTAKVYMNFNNNSITQLDNELYGYFIFFKKKNSFLVKYKTNLLGCSDWIFPKSNATETSNFDTILLEEIGQYTNPKIAFLKKNKESNYESDYSSEFIILQEENLDNGISFYWEKENFKKKNFTINVNDCIVVH